MIKSRYSLERSIPWSWDGVMDSLTFCSFTCSSGGAAVLTQEFLLLIKSRLSGRRTKYCDLFIVLKHSTAAELRGCSVLLLS